MRETDTQDSSRSPDDVSNAGYTPRTIQATSRAGKPVEIQVWVPSENPSGCAAIIVAALVPIVGAIAGIGFMVQNY